MCDVLIFTAGAAVKLGRLYTVRGALEEGLACSPHHWPCLENLIAVNFKVMLTLLLLLIIVVDNL